MSSKSITIISSYTVSKLVHFLRYTLYCTQQFSLCMLCLCNIRSKLRYQKQTRWRQWNGTQRGKTCCSAISCRRCSSALCCSFVWSTIFLPPHNNLLSIACTDNTQDSRHLNNPRKLLRDVQQHSDTVSTSTITTYLAVTASTFQWKSSIENISNDKQYSHKLMNLYLFL